MPDSLPLRPLSDADPTPPRIVPIKALWTIQDKKLLNVPFAQTGKLLILFTLLLTVSIIYEI